MIYFMRAGDNGPVKIGSARDPAIRLRYFRTGNPEPLSIVRVIEGGRKEERALHQAFRHLRIQGEWFRFDESMLSIEPPALKPKHKPTTPRTHGALQDKIEIPLDAPPHVRFHLYLQAIGWTGRELVRRLHCDTNLPTRWKEGRAEIPKPIMDWLGALAGWRDVAPIPTDWRTR